MSVDFGVAIRYTLDMAEWGKLNAGQSFHVLAVDMDRALAHLQLNRYENMLLQYVREHSWGISAKAKKRGEPWPDAAPCVVNTSDLARLWNVPRQRLNEAKWSLVNRRILTDDNCAVTINKTVEMWVGLSPEGLAYARAAQPTKDASPERPSVHVISEAPINDSPKHERDSVQGVNAPAFSACTSRTIEGTHASEFRRFKKNTDTHTPSVEPFESEPEAGGKMAPERRAILVRIARSLGVEEERPGVPNDLDMASIDRAIGKHTEGAALQLASKSRTKRSPLMYFLSVATKGGLDEYEGQPTRNGNGNGYAPPPPREDQFVKLTPEQLAEVRKRQAALEARHHG